MLDHAIRPLADPIRIQFEATRLIGERLGANRVVYTEVDGDWGTDKADYVRGVEALGYERFALSAYGPDLIEKMRAGEVVVIEDIETFPLTPEEKAEFLKGEIRSAIHVPLVKDGEMVALLGVHQATPRAWTDVEVTLV
jgi:GAF domain-containing protein